MATQVQYTILTEQQTSSMPAMGCLLELDDVLASSTGGQVCAPRMNVAGRLRRRIWPYTMPVLPPRQGGAIQVLVVTGITFGIVRALYSIPAWRRRFDVVCAYIMDAHVGYGASTRLRSSRFAEVLGSLDHVFIPMSGNVSELSSLFGVNVSVVPFGCDVLTWGSHRWDRPIDVIGYGRQHWAHSRSLARVFNAPDSRRIYHHTDFLAHVEVTNHHEQRALFWKTLQRAKIALAYDPRLTHPERFPFSFLAQRWMEGLAAGCLIAGRRPDCPETDQCFDWEGALVELPEDEDELLPFVEALLTDEARLQSTYRQNHYQALRRHDWRHRVAQMLDVLGLPRPAALASDLVELSRRADVLAGPFGRRVSARAAAPRYAAHGGRGG